LEPEIISVAKQMLSGLAYLHERSIVHQDIKPQNILFDKDGCTVKLADLGVSHILDRTRPTLSANCGTIRYMSPEQLDGILTCKIDIWAVGCVILEMITGESPYPGVANEFQISRFIVDKKMNQLDYIIKIKKRDVKISVNLR
jgi:serine/threonine protein kinase